MVRYVNKKIVKIIIGTAFCLRFVGSIYANPGDEILANALKKVIYDNFYNDENNQKILVKRVMIKARSQEDEGAVLLTEASGFEVLEALLQKVSNDNLKKGLSPQRDYFSEMFFNVTLQELHLLDQQVPGTIQVGARARSTPGNGIIEGYISIKSGGGGNDPCLCLAQQNKLGVHKIRLRSGFVFQVDGVIPGIGSMLDNIRTGAAVIRSQVKAIFCRKNKGSQHMLMGR